jgi:peptidyl-prolyl cis-trans isomerase B (cyclophilin B)
MFGVGLPELIVILVILAIIAIPVIIVIVIVSSSKPKPMLQFQKGGVMFCTKCGKENEANATNCVECGEVLTPAQPQSTAAPVHPRAATAPGNPQTAPMAPAQPMSAGAIWGFVLSLLSLLCFGPLTGIPAIIIGHIAYSNIKKSQDTIRGKGFAIAGLIIGYVGILIFIALFALGILGAIIEGQI